MATGIDGDAILEWRREAFLISTDRARIDLDLVHGFLTASYWAEGIPRETVARSIAGSLPFGLYTGERQIGFARVITDRATFAYLSDVFVLAEFRGRGLGVWLVETILAHPALGEPRTWLLATRDAHELYRRMGFVEAAPGRYMGKRRPAAYTLAERPDGG